MREIISSTRRPRFHRASEPPAFRLTDDDVVIIRQLARHRFLRSTHIAALVGRSLDRTNDRLSRLSMPATSIARAPSSTTTRLRDRRPWLTPLPIAARGS
jgi:hypothetical protein